MSKNTHGKLLRSTAAERLVFELGQRSLRHAERPTAFAPSLRLELGRWCQNRLEEEISRIYSTFATTGDRLAAWAEALIGTPSKCESSLPNLARHEVRIRFESFDCVTLIYTCLALARSSNFEQFVVELISTRYANIDLHGVDNCPSRGNFLDFVDESLLEQAVATGVLSDVTRMIVGSERSCVKIETELVSWRRPSKRDPLEQVIRPFYGERKVSATFISAERLSEVLSAGLRAGDIVLVTKGGDRETLVHHCYIATRRPGPTAYIHASVNGFFYTPANWERLAASEDAYSEVQCGVCRGANYAGDEYVLQGEHMKYHPYLEGSWRPLEDAIASSFIAALVLRPC